MPIANLCDPKPLPWPNPIPLPISRSPPSNPAPSPIKAAIVIGPANCEAATGWPWRWVRDHARELGVPLLGAGRKCGVRADLLVAALERQPAVPDNEAATPADPAEVVRQLLRRAGGR